MLIPATLVWAPACAVESVDDDPAFRGAGVEVHVGVGEHGVDAEVCGYVCAPCPPGQVCTQVCQEVGNCGGSCPVVIDCAGGTHFDEETCACVPDEGVVGTPCGDNLCDLGEVCCNSSCGICTEPGGVCTQQYCPPELPGESCGNIVCPPGTECCNASCGICVEPGGACTQQYCG